MKRTNFSLLPLSSISVVISIAMFATMLTITGCQDAGKPIQPEPSDQDIDIALTSYDFGPVKVGFTKIWELRIGNTGERTLEITSASVEDTTGIYTVEHVSSQFIESGSYYNLEVAFTPDSIDTIYETVLTINSTDPDEGAFDVSLTGQGSETGIPDLVLTADQHDFGAVSIGDLRTQVIIMTNRGSDILVVDSIITDYFDEEVLFTNRDNVTGFELEPNQHLDMIVTFRPKSGVSVNAKIRIYSNDPSERVAEISITGTGSSGASWSNAVKPIFDQMCVSCHGGNGGLFLDTYADAIEGGNSGTLILPGDAENSLLVKRIEGRITPQMPIGGSLSEDQIDVIRRWIDDGASND